VCYQTTVLDVKAHGCYAIVPHYKWEQKPLNSKPDIRPTIVKSLTITGLSQYCCNDHCWHLNQLHSCHVTTLSTVWDLQLGKMWKRPLMVDTVTVLSDKQTLSLHSRAAARAHHVCWQSTPVPPVTFVPSSSALPSSRDLSTHRQHNSTQLISTLSNKRTKYTMTTTVLTTAVHDKPVDWHQIVHHTPVNWHQIVHHTHTFSVFLLLVTCQMSLSANQWRQSADECWITSHYHYYSLISGLDQHWGLSLLSVTVWNLYYARDTDVTIVLSYLLSVPLL